MKTTLALTIATLSLVLTTMFSGSVNAQQKAAATTIDLPVMTFDLADGPDRDRVTAYCGICHGVEYIPMQPRLSRAQWTGTVTKMIKAFGAPVPQEDADKIVNYLSTAYGTGK